MQRESCFNEFKKEYDNNAAYLNSFSDVLSSYCSNAGEFLESAEDKYSKSQGEKVLVSPYQDKEEEKKYISMNDESIMEQMCIDLDLFTDCLCELVKSAFGEKNYINMENEVFSLLDAYTISYDEDAYISIHEDVLKTRSNRVIESIESMEPDEIEKEYLLMYNSYTSKVRYLSAFENAMEKVFGEDKTNEIMLKVAKEYTDSLHEKGLDHLVAWTPDVVHNRKEKFLSLLPTMLKTSALDCYKEMCDLYSSKIVEDKMIRDEISADPDKVAEADAYVNEEIYGSKEPTEQEQEVLDNLFSDLQ